jgi:hypothetical protein
MRYDGTNAQDIRAWTGSEWVLDVGDWIVRDGHGRHDCHSDAFFQDHYVDDSERLWTLLSIQDRANMTNMLLQQLKHNLVEKIDAMLGPVTQVMDAANRFLATYKKEYGDDG